MAATPGNYTADQIKSFGLNPDETTSTQTVGGVTYKLDNNNQGGRILSVVGGNTSGGGNTDYNSIIDAAIKKSQEAAQPAIQSLQSTVDPLKQRYTDLLKSIKGEQTTAENKQTVITSNELGKRGILGSSTLAGQEIQNAVQPVTSSYNKLYADTGIAEQDQLNAITQAIAQLQSGAASSGLSLGSNLYDTQQKALANEITKQKSNEPTYQQVGNTLYQFDRSGNVLKTLQGLQTSVNNYYGDNNTTSGTARYAVV